jgi:hypothetical protein
MSTGAADRVRALITARQGEEVDPQQVFVEAGQLNRDLGEPLSVGDLVEAIFWRGRPIRDVLEDIALERERRRREATQALRRMERRAKRRRDLAEFAPLLRLFRHRSLRRLVRRLLLDLLKDDLADLIRETVAAELPASLRALGVLRNGRTVPHG